MQSINTNPATIINAKSEAINTQQVTLPINQHISDIQERLHNNTVSKTFIERKINILETLYPATTNNESLKSSLKKIENLLKQFYPQKPSIDINLGSASSSETSIEQNKKLFEELDLLATIKCFETDDTLTNIVQHVKCNDLEIDYLFGIQDELNNTYNGIYDIITNNSIIAADVLNNLCDALKKINNAKDSISLLIKKEILNSQLKSYEKDSTDKKEKAKELQKILASEENFDVFENFSPIYKGFMKQYLLSIDADCENCDYELELTLIKDKNTENKKIEANNLKQKEAVKKITILKDKIIALAEKLENINDINI